MVRWSDVLAAFARAYAYIHMLVDGYLAAAAVRWRAGWSGRKECSTTELLLLVVPAFWQIGLGVDAGGGQLASCRLACVHVALPDASTRTVHGKKGLQRERDPIRIDASCGHETSCMPNTVCIPPRDDLDSVCSSGCHSWPACACACRFGPPASPHSTAVGLRWVGAVGSAFACTHARVQLHFASSWQTAI